MIFFSLLFMLALSFILVQHNDTATGLTKIFIDYHIHFMILLGLFGIGLGIISYSSFTSQQKDIKQTHKTSKEILLRFLEPTEQKILLHVAKNKKTTQAKISHLKEIGKVKAHRTIQKLEEKKTHTNNANRKNKRNRTTP
jgi:hypothetical protein